ncbi:unnamed protein product [Ixodes persulcatus]
MKHSPFDPAFRRTRLVALCFHQDAPNLYENLMALQVR